MLSWNNYHDEDLWQPNTESVASLSTNTESHQNGSTLSTEPFPGARCALSWLDEQAIIRKEKNFFEPA